MSTIKSLEKLYELSRWLDGAYVTDEGGNFHVYSHKPYGGMKSCGEHMRDLYNEIMTEIAERFIELPLDADGVLIRFGDLVREGDGVPVKVMSFTYFEDCCDVNLNGMNPNLLRHVNQRAIEDVLDEYYDQRGWDEAGNCALEAENLTAKYADEIRELIGVG